MNKKLINELHFLYQYIKKSKRSFVLFFIGWHLEAIVNLMLPLLFGYLIDEIVYYKNSTNLLKIMLVIIVVSVFLCSLYFFIYTFYNNNYGKYATNIKLDIMKHLARLDMSKVQEYKNGEIITMVDNYTDECITIINRNVIYTFYCIFVIITYSIYIFFVNVKLGLCAGIFVILSTIISLKRTEKINLYAAKEKKVYGKYTGWLLEMINGIRDLRLLGAEDKVVKRFVKYINELLGLNLKKNIFTLHISNLADGITLTLRIVLFFIGARYIINGTLTLGLFTVVLAYYDEIRQNVLYLNGYFVDLQDRISYVRYIREFLGLPTEKENKNSEPVAFKTGEILFDNVTFSYNECELLTHLNLHINDKDHVALVGKSGGGKSTLTSLLLAFIYPVEGNIYVDGNDIKNMRLKDLRRQIGIVQQRAYIFNGTVRENLLYGKLGATEEEMLEACKRAHIYDFIMNLDKQLDTMVGEGGVSLSGGQAQRLAIARIFLKNPSIIIFDESTSALDSKTENSILNEWDLFTDKTIIVISHKFSTIARCNKVAVLENGVISNYGDTGYIVENNQYFRNLFSIE